MVATNGSRCWNSLLAAAGTALVMQLDRVSQTFHEPPVVERLAQEVYRLAQGLDKLAHAVAGQFVIINDRDQWSFGHP
jgi:hypothetical protein